MTTEAPGQQEMINGSLRSHVKKWELGLLENIFDEFMSQTKDFDGVVENILHYVLRQRRRINRNPCWEKCGRTFKSVISLSLR